MDRLERHAWNERLLREANRRVVRLTKDLAGMGFAKENEVCEFFCACGSPDCNERIRMSVAEFERVHTAPHRFIVAPGHEDDRLETVAERHADYFVAEKRPAYQRPDPGAS